MACELWQDRLAPYVDGELSSAEAAEFGQHARQCVTCTADVLESVRMKRLVAVAGRAYTPSSEFRVKMMKSMMPTQRPSLLRSWRPLAVPLVLALALALAVAAYLGKTSSERTRIYSELTDSHVATLASASPVDVISTDRHTVKPWFEGRIPFSFNLPELQGTEFSLIGGKVAYLKQTPGAHLIYRLRKHEISVFIFPDRQQNGGFLATKTTSDFSFNIQSWTKGQLRYFVIGDVSTEDLASLSKLLRDAT
jgi:anti-sigma factor RsiW